MENKKRIAINGFGRIGRLATRIIIKNFPEMEVVAINDLTSVENLAYLFKHDSTYRTYDGTVESGSNNIIIDKLHKIKVFSEKDATNLPWKELNIDVVLECTGFYLTRELAESHIKAGAKKVILSAPAKSEDIKTVVFGANISHADFSDYLSETILSNASCTTNCIAPVLNVLQEQFALHSVFGLTNHAYTATQPLQDGPTKKEYRDGRAGAINLIPSKTGAAKAVELVLPDLSGKINLSSLRVPVQVGSMVYVVAQLEESQTTSAEEVNFDFQTAADTYLKGILEYSTSDLVSSDIIGNSHSVVFDSQLTEVLDNTIKLVIWYDNEWGYSNRLVELARLF
jgi:glyceraldehyde 3-phosphate dehydrogenase